MPCEAGNQVTQDTSSAKANLTAIHAIKPGQRRCWQSDHGPEAALTILSTPSGNIGRWRTMNVAHLTQLFVQEPATKLKEYG
jgi:hypothetical protein